MVKARANDTRNYQLSSFTPRCFNREGNDWKEVSYETFKRQQSKRLTEIRQQLAKGKGKKP